ncbi:recombinase RecT [Streptomyces sp. NBC_00024]|uniref:recombinase RecT n=1 Tax=Streptomyces sp. NBC_00024 TaxID=2903612 RepID=UPI0032529C9F
MTNDLKSRLRAARAKAAGGGIEQHDQADGVEETPAGHDERAAASFAEWLGRYGGDVEAALPKHIDPRGYLAVVRAALPNLIGRCTPASILQSVITCARFGLLPDGQQAVITAEDRTAVFIPTYRGYVDLMYRSGLVKSVVTGLVYQGDEWDFEPTAPAPLDFVHKPKILAPEAERGRPLFAYAFAWLDGGHRSAVAIVTREQAEETRDEYSRAYQRAEQTGAKNSFWHLRFDDMWIKTAIRRLAKLVPTSAELRALVAVERAAEDGRPQILAAIDPETVALEAEARRAAAAAESSQDITTTRTLPRKASADRGRAKPRRRNRDGKRR